MMENEVRVLLTTTNMALVFVKMGSGTQLVLSEAAACDLANQILNVAQAAREHNIDATEKSTLQHSES